jgi:hypothetical protein
MGMNQRDPHGRRDTGDATRIGAADQFPASHEPGETLGSGCLWMVSIRLGRGPGLWWHGGLNSRTRGRARQTTWQSAG